MGEPAPDEDAWIETVVRVAGALGANQMRLRWKLMRWQDSRRKARRRREVQIEHIRYKHKTCPECGAVQDKDEPICTGCGAALTRRGVQVLQRIGLSTPQFLSMSTVLALAVVGVYLRVWLAAGGGLGSPSVWVLYQFGGHTQSFTDGEPWRLVTAMFLHAGLVHLGFNLLAIASVGPRIEESYGRLTMLMVFVVTGALANLGSELMGLAGVGVGASGGVMGLIAAAAAHGHRLGTAGGRALRDGMLKWIAYTIFFGLWIHADNWAHVFGALIGGAFGFAVRPQVWASPQLLAVRALGKLLGVVVAVGALVVIFTREPPAIAPADDDDDGDRTAEVTEQLAQYVRICGMEATGDHASALAAARRARLGERTIRAVCDEIYQLRAQCRSPGSSGSSGSSGSPGSSGSSGSSRGSGAAPFGSDGDREQAVQREMCRTLGLDALPDWPATHDRPAQPGPDPADGPAPRGPPEERVQRSP